MQGMIADTGPAYRLYEHHQTVPMILDWIFHPFRHLEGGHMMMHHAGGAAAGPHRASPTGGLIFLQVPSAGDTAEVSRSALFGIGAARLPQFFAGVDLHTLAVHDVQPLGRGTGWGRVPTPMF